MKKILCLDFDGVICNSIDETLVVSYNAYRIYQRLITEPEPDPQIPEAILTGYRQFRYLVRPAKEFWVLMHLLHQGINRINQAEFSHYILDYGKEMSAYEVLFFDTRQKLMDLHLADWLDHHTQYSQSKEAWAPLQEKFNIYLVTTKNLPAVTHLNKYFTLGIADNKIWTKEKMDNKRNAIETIALEHGKY